MATDTLVKDIVAKTFPFQQQASFNATRYSTVPWGQALIDESFETPAISAGNDGLINIDVELPSDYVLLLRNFHLQVSDPNAINWGEAVVGFAYQTPGGPYKTSVSAYSEDEYSWYQLVPDGVGVKDRFNTSIRYQLWNFGSNPGTGFLAFDNSWDPTQLPLWIPPSVDSSFKARQMVLYIENTSASQPAQTMTLRCSWDLYTFEQAYSAAVMSSPRVFS